jgi:hypothetical protein
LVKGKERAKEGARKSKGGAKKLRNDLIKIKAKAEA